MTDNDATQTRQDDATKQLRAMLDERGVEWWPSDDLCCEDIITHWRVGQIKWTTIEGEKDLWLNAGIAGYEPFTPAQVIAATLGAGTCTLINAADDLGSGTSSSMCFECGYTALDDWWEEFNFCPNCGRKVVEE